jgi:fructokinase
MKILSFGEIIWDVYDDRAVIGGAPMNFTAHCVKCGAEGYILSAVGHDALGIAALSELSRLGVNSAFVGKSEHPTGSCRVTLDSNGIPTYSLATDTAYDYIQLTEGITEQIRNECFDALCFGTLAQRNAISARTLKELLAECKFKEIFCDLNLRPNGYCEASVRLCLEHAITLKLSEEEAPLLESIGILHECALSDPRAAMAEIFQKYPNIQRILYTKGADGSEIHTREECIGIAPVRVEAISSVGAGDSYGAAWITAMLGGASYADAARLAARVSAFVVSCKEAVPNYSVEQIPLYL